MSDLYELAISRWIESFIIDNDREPTDEEIEAGSEDAFENYIAAMTDETHDRMKDEEMGL